MASFTIEWGFADILSQLKELSAFKWWSAEFFPCHGVRVSVVRFSILFYSIKTTTKKKKKKNLYLEGYVQMILIHWRGSVCCLGMASSRPRCDVGSFYIMLFFSPRLFCFVSFLSVVSMFCDCGSFCLLLPLFVCLCLFVFCPLYQLTKHFIVTVKLTKQISGSRYSSVKRPTPTSL